MEKVNAGGYLWNAVDGYIQQGLEADRRGYTNAAGVFQCPSPLARNKVYGVNMGGIGDDFISGRGLAGRAVYEFASLKAVLPTTESSVKVPSAVIALGDSLAGFTHGAILDGFAGMIVRSSTMVAQLTDQEIAATIRTQSRRHGLTSHSATVISTGSSSMRSSSMKLTRHFGIGMSITNPIATFWERNGNRYV